jgi:hypothetical protein
VLNLYAAAIEAAIHRCTVVVTYSLNTVQLSPNTGYVEGEITFIDSSRLVFFEFLRQTATHFDREKYRYHFMDAHNQLIFRYDDVPHYPGMATFPHHKHLPTGVTDSPAPRFAEVLAEIEAHVLGIP